MPSHLRRSWESLRKLPERTPLRVKLVSALLALVAIALTVISVSSLVVFRSYLETHAEDQLQLLLEQALHTGQHGGPHGSVFGLPGYVLEVQDAQGNVVDTFSGWRQPDVPGPKIPTDSAWLTAHTRKFATVPAVSGSDNWRVITAPF